MILKSLFFFRFTVCITILLLICANCSPSVQQFSIIFSADLDGNQDLYQISSQDFHQLKKITNTPFETEGGIKISADGKKILYSVYGDKLTWFTYLHNLESREVTSLQNPASRLHSIQSLAWINGENSAVVSEQQQRKVYIVNLDTNIISEFDIPRRNSLSNIIDLEFSFDGKKILYIDYNKDSPLPSVGIPFLYDLETKEGKPLIENDHSVCNDPKWSPLGNQALLNCFMYTDNGEIDNHVYLISISEDNPVDISEIADLSCGAQFWWGTLAKYAWSPDGRQFVTSYCEMYEGAHTLYVYNSDGSLERSLKGIESDESDVYITELAWTPDGNRLIFIAGESEDTLDIYMVNIDGSNKQRITNVSSNYEGLSVFTPGS